MAYKTSDAVRVASRAAMKALDEFSKYGIETRFFPSITYRDEQYDGSSEFAEAEGEAEILAKCSSSILTGSISRYGLEISDDVNEEISRLLIGDPVIENKHSTPKTSYNRIVITDGFRKNIGQKSKWWPVLIMGQKLWYLIEAERDVKSYPLASAAIALYASEEISGLEHTDPEGKSMTDAVRKMTSRKRTMENVFNDRFRGEVSRAAADCLINDDQPLFEIFPEEVENKKSLLEFFSTIPKLAKELKKQDTRALIRAIKKYRESNPSG